LPDNVRRRSFRPRSAARVLFRRSRWAAVFIFGGVLFSVRIQRLSEL
jgi:hypothetical protein